MPAELKLTQLASDERLSAVRIVLRVSRLGATAPVRSSLFASYSDFSTLQIAGVVQRLGVVAQVKIESNR
jgi:hypothetical protein